MATRASWLMRNHKWFERHTFILIAGILVTVAIGGLIEIVPLFYLKNTIEKVEGVRPYTPLELAGQNIYIREGCGTCHSQMIRPLRDEVERYGHYSLAAESMYDHPFQWGSKRTGPDLARVGGKYSDEWQTQHLIDPRSLVPESIMPPYAFMNGRKADLSQIAEQMQALRLAGVPYTDDMIARAGDDARAQAGLDYDVDSFRADYEKLSGRAGTVIVRDFDGARGEPTEIDALVAYLQVLGTMVDFSTYEARFLLRERPAAHLIEFTESGMTALPSEPERDRAPRVQDKFGGARHAIERRMTAHEAGEAQFLADVAGRTIALVKKHGPACVALCAPPHALGQLRKLLECPLKRLAVVSVDKDITKESVSEIDARLRELHA